MYKKSI